MKGLRASVLALAVLFAFGVPAVSQFVGVTVKSSTEAGKTPAVSEASKVVVKGKVVDQNGKPVAKAKVYHVTVKPNTRETTLHELKVDKTGAFSHTLSVGPERTRSTFVAIADGYSYGTGHYDSQEKNEVEFKLLPEYKLKGKVVDERGKPLTGALVELTHFWAYNQGTNESVSLPGNIGHMMETATGKNGQFTLRHMIDPREYDQGQFMLRLSKAGRASVTKSFQSSDVDSDISMKLPLECVVEGTMYLPDKAGYAPEGTSVFIKVSPEYGWEPRQGKVGKEGKFRIATLPPGKISLALGRPEPFIGPDGKVKMPEPLKYVLAAVRDKEITPGKATNLELVMLNGAVIKGTVTNKDNGEPMKDAVLAVDHAGSIPGMYWDQIRTDEKGAFTARVVAGDVKVMVQQFGGSYYGDRNPPSVSVQVADGEEKADVQLAVAVSENRNNIYQLISKPIPADFELKPGSYELVWDGNLDCSDVSRSWNTKLDQVLKAEPKLASTKARRETYAFDGKSKESRIGVILDESKGTGKGFDTAYIDCNRNLDLTDDQPIKFSVPENYGQIYTDWVTVQSHQGEGEGQTNNPVQARLQIYSSGDNIYPTLQKKGGWKGVIDSSKGKVECAVADNNCNGIYGDSITMNEKLEPSGDGDTMFLDTNGAGKVLVMDWGSHALRLQTATKIGDKYYQIKVTQPGNKINVEPYAGPTGKLLVRGENIQGLKAQASTVYVVGEAGYYEHSCENGQPITLPAGKYKVNYCYMTLQSKKKPLQISCQMESPTEVKAGEQAEAVIRGGLSMAIDPDKKDLVWNAGASQSINWIIKIGDKVTLSSIGDRSDSSAPKVNFYDMKGNLLQSVKAGFT